MTSGQAEQYMLSKPDSVFAVFTHVDGNRLSADYLIRWALSRVYRVPVDETFSHCGVVWNVNGRLRYFHQTYPNFRKDFWWFRSYNVIFEIDDPKEVANARQHAERLYEQKRGYAIGTLINFVFSIWFSWMGNAIKVGKVCSGALARILEGYILTGRHTKSYNVDPHYAYQMLWKAGLPMMIVNLKKKEK